MHINNIVNTEAKIGNLKNLEIHVKVTRSTRLKAYEIKYMKYKHIRNIDLVNFRRNVTMT